MTSYNSYNIEFWAWISYVHLNSEVSNGSIQRFDWLTSWMQFLAFSYSVKFSIVTDDLLFLIYVSNLWRR